MTENIKEDFRCGIVSIIGRPNVGKSTLLNKIVGEKVAIVSRIPQTTRSRIRGIYTERRGQIIFIDTPGLHSGKDRLADLMNQTASGTFKDADCLIYLADTSRTVGEEEHNVVQKLKYVKAPIIMGLNKVDCGGANIPAYITLWEETRGMKVTDMENFSMVAISGEDGINIDKLLDVIFSYLPVGPALYPLDVISDTPQKMVVADLIREKLFALMHSEVPHSIGVMIEHMKTSRNLTRIDAVVFVERPSQKEIVIGKKGEILKKVGTLARQELEGLLETKVYLDLFVKVQKDWRDSSMLLEELGYGPPH